MSNVSEGKNPRMTKGGGTKGGICKPLENTLIFRARVFQAFLRHLSGIFHGSCAMKNALSGPLNRLNAILSLLHPLDRYRTPSAIGSAIGRPLSRRIRWESSTASF